jgi:hypothetical protein
MDINKKLQGITSDNLKTVYCKSGTLASGNKRLVAQLEIQTWTHDIKNIQRVDQNTKDTVSTFSITAKKHSYNEKAINLIKLQEGGKKGSWCR